MKRNDLTFPAQTVYKRLTNGFMAIHGRYDKYHLNLENENVGHNNTSEFTSMTLFAPETNDAADILMEVSEYMAETIYSECDPDSAIAEIRKLRAITQAMHGHFYHVMGRKLFQLLNGERVLISDMCNSDGLVLISKYYNDGTQTVIKYNLLQEGPDVDDPLKIIFV